MENDGLVAHDVLTLEANAVDANGDNGSGGTGRCSQGHEASGLPNQMGNTVRPRPIPESSQVTQSTSSESGVSSLPAHWMTEQWESNYKEAAIFLEEGVNNDKFTHHPRSCDALPAYLMVHNNWFHLIDLVASLTLLALGLVERPCKEPLCVPAQVHSSIELGLLILVAVQLSLKTRWLGWMTFFRHKRTLLKCCTLVLMLCEALVVLIRSNNHFRVSRALRPIFLMDNQFCGGVRRFIRQILQSLPPIMDMLVLVFFVMLIYSVFGFYLFGAVDPKNFGSLHLSFISLFVLLTTANYPDVMMRSYDASRWSALFFISYLSVNLYFLMNLMLAVVYDAFTRIEKDKFRRLFLHKRKAAQHAFKLLVTKERPEQVNFQHFEGMLKFYSGVKSSTEAYLVFKLLNTSNTGYLSIDEFYHIYDASLYKWRVARPEKEWFHDFVDPLRRFLATVRVVVLHQWFEFAICFAVLTNGIILVIQTWIMQDSSSAEAANIYAPWVSYFFVGLYTMEACFKLLGLGFSQYFASFWNLFDFSVTTLGILSLVLEVLDIPLFYIVILRPLRLLTLFRMKRRFRDVFGTAVILYPRLTSAIFVLVLIYYFFAVIGMECFNHIDLINCCKNTSIEPYFNYDGEGAATNGFFYLNNFQSLLSSFVTLFELTVVNNWYVIMEGYALTTSGGDWSRLFFMSFYIFTMIVMTIIVAFILEAFLFRIQYKQFLSKHDEQKKLSAQIHLSSEEVLRLLRHSGPLERNQLDIAPDSNFQFEGLKPRTKEQLQMLMYTEEMDSWLAEACQEETNCAARVQAALLREGQQQDRNREAVQVVADDGEVTTIHRTYLPDL